MTGQAASIRSAAERLLHTRGADKTVCPSEIARAAAADCAIDDWRALMPAVHAHVDDLSMRGKVALSWKGRVLPARDGPYRIRGIDTAD